MSLLRVKRRLNVFLACVWRVMYDVSNYSLGFNLFYWIFTPHLSNLHFLVSKRYFLNKNIYQKQKRIGCDDYLSSCKVYFRYTHLPRFILVRGITTNNLCLLFFQVRIRISFCHWNSTGNDTPTCQRNCVLHQGQVLLHLLYRTVFTSLFIRKIMPKTYQSPPPVVKYHYMGYSGTWVREATIIKLFQGNFYHPEHLASLHWYWIWSTSKVECTKTLINLWYTQTLYKILRWWDRKSLQEKYKRNFYIK